MPARSVCLVTLSLSEAGPGRFGCQVSVTDIYHTMPYHTCREVGPGGFALGFFFFVEGCCLISLCFVFGVGGKGLL